MPRISVVVPLYNKARYIDRCLDAIFGQSFTDFEVIVVNDGSTDGSETIVQARRDPRLKLVSQQNAGPGAARNYGVSLASSRLVAFLDADDSWDPDYLKESVARMDSLPPEVAVLTWGLMIYPRGETMESLWKRSAIPHGRFQARPDSPAGLIVAMLAYMTPSATVIRKAAFEAAGGFYAKYRCLYSEDAWLYLRLLLEFAAEFDYRPMAIRFEDAAELSANLDGVRPIEPFLLDPEGVLSPCPEPMRPLVREVLAWRALKTASVYGYWGEFRQARELLARFVSAGDWRAPYFLPAMVGATPVGGWAGKLARAAGHRRGK